MKYLPIYKKLLGCRNPQEVFRHLIDNLKESTLIWSYFVNWEKVFKNVKDIEISLNILNYLIGKKNFDDELKYLIKKNPKIINVIPVLAVRDGSNRKKFKILVDYKRKQFAYEDFDFENCANVSEDNLAKIAKFIEQTGIKRLFTENKIKNIVDYVIGVEAGLDSNARKNRGGKAMEEIVEYFISDICRNHSFTHIKEATADEIKQRFGFSVPTGKSSRRYDFAIYNKKRVYVVEANFYSGGGSKLKATAGEYRSLHDTLAQKKVRFIWITDGLGWKSTYRPLLETFNHNDYLLSLAMLEKGILDKIMATDQ